MIPLLTPPLGSATSPTVDRKTVGGCSLVIPQFLNISAGHGILISDLLMLLFIKGS